LKVWQEEWDDEENEDEFDKIIKSEIEKIKNSSN